MNSATIVQKLWNYCNVLRDDGMKFRLIAGDLGADAELADSV